MQEYDDVLTQLSEVGKFELLLIILLSVPSFGSLFPNLSIVFLAGVPEHWCSVPDLTRFNLSQEQIRSISIPFKNGTGSYDSCTMYDRNYSSWTEADVSTALDNLGSSNNWSTVECFDGWNYDRSQYTSTIVSEWDLVCSHQWKRATASSIYFFGFLVGLPISGVISDLIGRKPVFCVLSLLMCALSIATAFVNSYVAFIVLRFFIGVFQISIFTAAFVMLVETVAPSWRAHAGMATMYTWALAYMICALAAYALRDWFTFQICCTVLASIQLVYIWFLPESPRWLFANNKPREGKQVLAKIAKFNKVELPEKLEISVKTMPRGSPLDTVRTPRMRCRSINLFFNWAVNSMVYYGLSLNSSNLGGNDYVNFFISGAVEIPAYVLSHFSVSWFGRRWSLAGAELLGGLSLIAILVVPAGLNWLVIALAMTGKFAITASFAIVYIITAELYPTKIRNIGVSSGSFFSRIGGIIAPFLAELGSTSRVLPPLIFGSASIAAGLLAFLLPETMGKNLPETMQDGEDFGKGSESGLCGQCCSERIVQVTHPSTIDARTDAGAFRQEDWSGNPLQDITQRAMPSSRF